MIHVCFAIHDKNEEYVKYLAVAICSLLNNTSSEVTVHLLHDYTLSMKMKMKIRQLVEGCNKTINFYEISHYDFCEYEKMCAQFSVASLYRLKICEILPNSVYKVIYLDADIIVNLDIKLLWEFDLGESFIAARKDLPNNPFPVRIGAIPQDKYFNSGVMIYSLEKIRNGFDAYRKCLSCLRKYQELDFPDQDALNLVFYNNVTFFPRKFNFFSIEIRNKTSECEDECIFHFAGDKIMLDNMEICDVLFLYYLAKTPWGKEEFSSGRLRKLLCTRLDELLIYRSIISLVSTRSIKKIIWSPKSVLMGKLAEIIPLDLNVDYGVDNDKCTYKSKFYGLSVKNPKQIKKEKRGTYIVIILSNRFVDDIRRVLLSFGLQENVDFYDGRKILMDKPVTY